MTGELKVQLVKSKTTKNTVRYDEQTSDHPLAVYLTHARVQQLGSPDTITITIQKS